MIPSVDSQEYHCFLNFIFPLANKIQTTLDRIRPEIIRKSHFIYLQDRKIKNVENVSKVDSCQNHIIAVLN